MEKTGGQVFDDVQVASSVGVNVQRQIFHDVIKSCGHDVLEIRVRRPIFQLQQHRLSLVVLKSLFDILESIPKRGDFTIAHKFGVHAIDEVRSLVAKLC